jgi:pre-mRNA-splicing factor SYF2
MTERKYEKSVERIKPVKCLEEGKEALANEIKEDQEKRTKLSKRKAYDAEEDVTFINERNARFNRKASRAYDNYTEDLREK